VDNWFIVIVAGIPALYYAAKFWGEVTRLILMLLCLLAALCAQIMDKGAAWLLDKLEG
jgi:hypothetical protein